MLVVVTPMPLPSTRSLDFYMEGSANVTRRPSAVRLQRIPRPAASWKKPCAAVELSSSGPIPRYLRRIRLRYVHHATKKHGRSGSGTAKFCMVDRRLVARDPRQRGPARRSHPARPTPFQSTPVKPTAAQKPSARAASNGLLCQKPPVFIGKALSSRRASSAGVNQHLALPQRPGHHVPAGTSPCSGVLLTHHHTTPAATVPDPRRPAPPPPPRDPHGLESCWLASIQAGCCGSPG